MRAPSEPKARVSVVRPGERQPVFGLPPGATGDQLFHANGRWVALAGLEPGRRLEWHHHGEWETFAYVLRGRLRVEYVDGEKAAIDAGLGDFIHFAPNTVHRETSAGREAVETSSFASAADR